jgi:hypothetical protein
MLSEMLLRHYLNLRDKMLSVLTTKYVIIHKIVIHVSAHVKQWCVVYLTMLSVAHAVESCNENINE